jgi:hypothetical protein
MNTTPPKEDVHEILADRQKDYGHPYDDFKRVAEAASAYGFSRNGNELSPSDVPFFMILLKLSRETHKHKDDNLTDIKGYTVCWERSLEEEKQRREGGVVVEIF